MGLDNCTHCCTIRFMGTPKVKNASNFRTELFDTLKDVSNGEAHLITHNAGEPVILIAKSEYDALLDEREYLKDVAIGAEPTQIDER